MALFERVDADGVTVERAFTPSARPDRDARVRALAEAGAEGWREVADKPARKPARRKPAAGGEEG